MFLNFSDCLLIIYNANFPIVKLYRQFLSTQSCRFDTESFGLWTKDHEIQSIIAAGRG